MLMRTLNGFVIVIKWFLLLNGLPCAAELRIFWGFFSSDLEINDLSSNLLMR